MTKRTVLRKTTCGGKVFHYASDQANVWRYFPHIGKSILFPHFGECPCQTSHPALSPFSRPPLPQRCCLLASPAHKRRTRRAPHNPLLPIKQRRPRPARRAKGTKGRPNRGHRVLRKAAVPHPAETAVRALQATASKPGRPQAPRGKQRAIPARNKTQRRLRPINRRRNPRRAMHKGARRHPVKATPAREQITTRPLQATGSNRLLLPLHKDKPPVPTLERQPPQRPPVLRLR